ESQPTRFRYKRRECLSKNKKMIRHVYSVLCTRMITDRDTNNVSLIEIVERLAGPADPEPAQGLIAIQLDFVSMWARSNPDEPTRGRARLKYLSPDNNSMADPIVYPVDLSDLIRVRNLTRFGAIPLRGGGTYHFVVEFEREDRWEEVARYPL